MTVRDILKMGDARLLRVAPPVQRFDTPELHALIADMFDTMEAAQGAGLAAPQIGVDLQLVIFGFSHNERYPEAPAVPRTVLINPTITPLSEEEEQAGKAACRCRDCAASCHAGSASTTAASTRSASPSRARPKASMHASCSTSAIT